MKKLKEDLRELYDKGYTQALKDCIKALKNSGFWVKSGYNNDTEQYMYSEDIFKILQNLIKEE